ncbi:hypothetical protein MKK68_07175 [Methylobacterium sp. E-016]|uniref:hypothetical protein n=1 Tax=Methylobacterium sp. E-016 TaxID=2836556 RepID=UPI001FBBFD16|nr:hypothetical protein [Methylobacterium sp. E-016]MCJ2075438.1 hypothetical protein [Methylobacterium sp. E-016]
MDETTLRLQARVTVLEQLTVRLFSILSVEHASSIIATVESVNKAIQNSNESEIFGDNLTAEDKIGLSREAAKEWAIIRSRILGV